MDLPARLRDDTQLLYLLVALSVVGAILYLRSIPSEAGKVSDGAAIRPPHVWGWIPWLGCGLALGKDPDGFLTDTRSVREWFQKLSVFQADDWSSSQTHPWTDLLGADRGSQDDLCDVAICDWAYLQEGKDVVSAIG